VSVSFAGIIRFRFDGSAFASQPYGTPTDSGNEDSSSAKSRQHNQTPKIIV